MQCRKRNAVNGAVRPMSEKSACERQWRVYSGSEQYSVKVKRREYSSSDPTVYVVPRKESRTEQRKETRQKTQREKTRNVSETAEQ